MPEPIDENQINGGESKSAEETGPVVLWPAAAIEAAMADRDRLFDIIDRAALALCEIHDRGIAEAIADLEGDCPGYEGTIELLATLGRAIHQARDVLAEAEPGDPEGGGGGDG
jgi:hypothetical protein